MQNKQHEFVLKAFVESKIPYEIKKNAPELIALDSIIGGYCTQIIKNYNHKYAKKAYTLC